MSFWARKWCCCWCWLCDRDESKEARFAATDVC